MANQRTVAPDVLRQLREAKRLTRARLADKSNISDRQLRRLEDGKAPLPSIRDNTLMKLARALEVEPGMLTGEIPPPKFTQRPARVERSPIRAMIEPKARLAYTLLKQRYGVNATDIINMAPLFFTLLAEGSLAWRREQLDAAEDAMEAAVAIGDGHGHLAFMKAAYHVQNGLIGEGDSIKAHDLFGEKVSDDAHYWDYDSSTENPFAAYLRKLAHGLGKADVVSVTHEPLGVGLSPEYPDYDVCGAELDKIANHSVEARRVLEVGHARLDEIPSDLRGDDAGEQRAAWLESKAPPKPVDASDLIDSFPDDDQIVEIVEKIRHAREADLSELLPPPGDGTGEDS